MGRIGGAEGGRARSHRDRYAHTWSSGGAAGGAVPKIAVGMHGVGEALRLERNQGAQARAAGVREHEGFQLGDAEHADADDDQSDHHLDQAEAERAAVFWLAAS